MSVFLTFEFKGAPRVLEENINNLFFIIYLLKVTDYRIPHHYCDLDGDN